MKIVVLSIALLVQSATNQLQVEVPVNAVSQPTNQTTTTQYICDAKPYRHLIGRTLGDLSSIRLPPNTRIYRITEQPQFGEAGHNRLNIEINYRTRVRRVYCS